MNNEKCDKHQHNEKCDKLIAINGNFIVEYMLHNALRDGFLLIFSDVYNYFIRSYKFALDYLFDKCFNDPRFNSAPCCF